MKVISHKASYVLILVFHLVFASNEELLVHIKNGLIQGKYMKSENGRQFLSFMGIPYAKPPLGELRFKPPVPIENWEGIKSATEDYVMCVQIDLLARQNYVQGSEDCLFLSVYTPKINTSNLLPVMAFVHGGGYLAGTGNAAYYGPEYLMDRDVVLVSMNYRLGPLGFLTTGDSVVPGNMGMKDVTLALKWIKENIKQFGGDPNSITTFRESAGGACTHLLMLSPLSKGLFHAAVSQSGTALSPWAILPLQNGVNKSKKLAGIFKCPTTNSKDMIKCLQNVNASDLMEEQKQFMEWDIDPLAIFTPVIEPKHDGAFIYETVENSLKLGLGSDVHWITGINTEEGSVRTSGILQLPNLLSQFNENFDKIIFLSLFRDRSIVTDAMVKKIRLFYFGNGDIVPSLEANITNLYTDVYFSYINKAIDLHRKYLKSPVYNYLFGYRGSFSFTQLFEGATDRDFGVCHGDELIYQFPIYTYFPGQYASINDKKMADVILNLWTNFAKYRKPTVADSNITWSPVKSTEKEYLHILNHENIQMDKNMFKERFNFWKKLEAYYKLMTPVHKISSLKKN